MIHALSVGKGIRLARVAVVINPAISGAIFPFCACQHGSYELGTVSYPRWMSTASVLADLAEHRLQPACIHEMLAYAYSYPDQMETAKWLVALGSPHEMNGVDHFPTLHKDRGIVEGIGLQRSCEGWSPVWHFLVRDG